MLNVGLPWKRTKIRTTPSFFKIALWSATSIESSRRDLSNDSAEHRDSLKKNQNTHYSLIFQDRSMFSQINGKISPRSFELYGWIRCILKINQNTYYVRCFLPDTGKNSVKKVLGFYCGLQPLELTVHQWAQLALRRDFFDGNRLSS